MDNSIFVMVAVDGSCTGTLGTGAIGRRVCEPGDGAMRITFPPESMRK